MSDNWQIGARVRVVTPIEIFPIDIFAPGLTGTITQLDMTAHDVVAHVRLDQHHDGLDEWNNELQVWPDSTDESNCTLGKFEIIKQAPRSLATLAADARPTSDDDWGSERQLAAENAFFDAFHTKMGDTPDFDHWCLKATTEEMLDEALRMIQRRFDTTDIGEVS